MCVCVCVRVCVCVYACARACVCTNVHVCFLHINLSNSAHLYEATPGQLLAEFERFKFRVSLHLDGLPYKT